MMRINPLTGLQEEDELSQVFGQFDNDRAALEQSQSGYDTMGAAAGALASLGAAFQGKDSLAAGMNVANQRKQDRKDQVSALDKWKASKIAEIQAKRDGVKAKRDDEEYARTSEIKKQKNDPTSSESQTWQSLAKKALPSFDATGMSAAQIEEKMPFLKSIADNELAKFKVQKDQESSLAKAKMESGQKGVEAASKLRTERSGLPTTKATQEVSAAYNRMQNASQTPSAAGDLSLIFNYMKMLDPGSTVREGEFANAESAAGVPTKVLNTYNKTLTGQRLSQEQRQDFLTNANHMYSAQMAVQKQVDENYRRLAEKGGLDPQDVLLNFDAQPVKTRQQLAKEELERRKAAKQTAGSQ
jgi:hypothetical protein